MTATIELDLQVREFALAVRRELADLGPDEVDELTDGLEADLSEQASDSDGFTLGDPVAYASELRTAAGLPIRPVERPNLVVNISAEWRRLQRRASAFVRSSAAGGSVLDFLASIRPVWWILRALVGLFVLQSIFGARWDLTALTDLSGAVLLVISIQWGRGRWMPVAGIRVLVVIANIVALLLIPYAANAITARISTYAYDQYASAVTSPAGLSRNGQQITNIFAYDSAGEPITGIQLFDQDGKALSVRTDPYSTYISTNDGQYLIPSAKPAGRSGWNVFPLGRIPLSAVENSTGELKSGITPDSVLFPFVKVRALVGLPSSDAGSIPTGESTTAPEAPAPSTSAAPSIPVSPGAPTATPAPSPVP